MHVSVAPLHFVLHQAITTGRHGGMPSTTHMKKLPDTGACARRARGWQWTGAVCPAAPPAPPRPRRAGPRAAGPPAPPPRAEPVAAPARAEPAVSVSLAFLISTLLSSHQSGLLNYRAGSIAFAWPGWIALLPVATISRASCRSGASRTCKEHDMAWPTHIMTLAAWRRPVSQ